MDNKTTDLMEDILAMDTSDGFMSEESGTLADGASESEASCNRPPALPRSV